jgi:hypothetical protein
MTKNPLPPKVGTLLTTGAKTRKVTYEVRAVVDPIEDEKYGWLYQIVLRARNTRKGHRYVLVGSHELGRRLFAINVFLPAIQIVPIF